jgi:hypothetical protein
MATTASAPCQWSDYSGLPATNLSEFWESLAICGSHDMEPSCRVMLPRPQIYLLQMSMACPQAAEKSYAFQ